MTVNGLKLVRVLIWLVCGRLEQSQSNIPVWKDQFVNFIANVESMR